MRIRKNTSSSRRGFGLVELLVIIAIIAMLLAFLLPAVQKVRAAAARTQSANNLKNIALSFHAFHDANKRFPFNGSDTAVAGAKYSKAAQGNNLMSGSWEFQILPFIEQQPLFNKPSPDVGIPTYLCPGRGLPSS